MQILRTVLLATSCLVTSSAIAQEIFDYNPPALGSSEAVKRRDLDLELDGINTDKVDFIDIDTSAEIRTILTDEVGTGVLVFLGTPADDQAAIGDSASGTTWRTIPDSESAGVILGYDQATNTFSTKADDDVPEAGDLGVIDTSAELRTLLTDELGTGVLFFLGAPGADDQAFISDSVSAGTWRTIPDSEAAGVILGYDQATNTWSTKTDDDVPEAGDLGVIDTSAEIRTLMTDEVGTGVLVFLGTPADDQVPVGDSATGTTWRTLPDSEAAGVILGYDQATNTFSTKTDDDVPEVSDFAALVGGSGIDNNSGTLDLDLTELNTFTLGAGAATGIIFDAGATDPAIETASGIFRIDIGGTDETVLTASAYSPGVNDGNALGETTTPLRWADLFLADGAVIDMGTTSSRATITHVTASDSITIHADPDNATASSQIGLSVDGASEAVLNSTSFSPGANDGNSLGISGTAWADLFLATGGLIEFDGGTTNTFTCTGGNCTIEGNTIYRAGGTDVALADGGTGASLVDPNLDRFQMWDDSAGTMKFADLASLTTEAAPAAGDFLLVQRAEDDIVKVNWSSLPGAAGGDSVTVNGSATTDADFRDTSEILFFLDTAPTPDQVTAKVARWLLTPVHSLAGGL